MQLIGAEIILPLIVLIGIALAAISFPIISLINHIKIKKAIFKRITQWGSANPQCSFKKGLKTDPYDYMLEQKNSVYYIKLTKNISSKKDLYINSADEIVFKSSKENDTKAFVKGLGPIKEFVPEAEPNKDVYKLVIVYPNVNFIFHYLNKHEYEYVYIDTVVYGMKYISAVDFINLEEL